MQEPEKEANVLNALPKNLLIATAFKRDGNNQHHLVCVTSGWEKDAIWFNLDIEENCVVIAGPHESVTKWQVYVAEDPNVTPDERVNKQEAMLAIFRAQNSKENEGFIVADNEKIELENSSPYDLVPCKLGSRKEAIQFKFNSAKDSGR